MFREKRVPVQNSVKDSSRFYFDSKKSITVGEFFEQAAVEFTAEEKREWEDYLKATFQPYRKGDEYTNDYVKKIETAQNRLVEILKKADYRLSATIPEAKNYVREEVEEYKNLISTEIARVSKINEELRYAENNLMNAEEELIRKKTLIYEMEKRLQRRTEE